MPTAAFNTFTNKKLVPVINPARAATKDIKIGASKTLLAGTLMAQVTATPGVYDAYADNGAGGLGVCLGVLEHDVTTDSAGNITNLSGPFASVPADINVPMYYRGAFLTTDIVGSPGILDDVIDDGVGRIIEGTTTTGIWEL